MSAERANIFGLLCSDGNYRSYISRYVEFDKRSNKYYKRVKNTRILEFANTNFMLLKKFQKLLYFVYKYKPNITLSNNNVFRVCITKHYVIDDIIKDVNLGNNKWSIPKFVMDGNKNIKIGFIKGFFDGDGSVDFTKNKTPRIRIPSTNLMGLKQIKIVLNKLKIESNFNGPYKRENRKDGYEILLKKKSIERFIKLIKSDHSKKKRRFKIIAEKLMPR